MTFQWKVISGERARKPASADRPRRLFRPNKLPPCPVRCVISRTVPHQVAASGQSALRISSSREAARANSNAPAPST